MEQPRRLGDWRRALWAQRLLAVAILVAGWQAVTAASIFSPDLLPAPADVFESAVLLPATSEFWGALRATLSSALLGLALGTVIAIPAGLLIGASPALDRTTRLLVDVFRATPIIALLPVLILLLGVTFKMEVMVVTLASIWPLLLQTAYGARRVEPVVEDMARSYRIPPHLRFLYVLLPHAAPFIMTGLRVAASHSLLVAIGTELLSQTPGLGYEIALDQQGAAIPEMMAYVLYSGLLGFVMNSGLVAIEGRMLAWHGAARERQ